MPPLRSTRLRLFVLGVLFTLPSRGARAQAASGTFAGIVTRDTLGHPVAGAEIVLPALRRTTQSDGRGEFRLGEVPAGRYLVTIRAIGFAPFADSISIVTGQVLDADLTLTPSTALLDTLRTTATRSTVETRALAEFEARRTAHINGAFLGDSALRANDLEKMASLLAYLPGVRIIHGKGTALYLASARATTDGRPAFFATTQPCFVSVYVDGFRTYQAHVGGDDPPNFAEMRASDFAGVEYYSSPNAAPAQFSATGSDCGVVVLWSRRDRTTAPPVR